MIWVRSSFCDGGTCVEVAQQGDSHVLVRDGKNPRMVLRVNRSDWDAFLAGVKVGEFDADVR